MKNEIAILDQVVDVAIGGGLFKHKDEAAAVINAIGVIKTQVPRIQEQLQDAIHKVEKLIDKNNRLGERIEKYEGTLKVGPSGKKAPQGPAKHK